ncbi:hypothetical protein BDN70DRAFT_931346 [Pholiota conissans]|uniref:DNA repair protein REV1 n=1 Tax=Pholiota conissans TaxID=109636 RepID=A0A9P5Z7H3_9AGAR|nr:hypothetical protein BDN70DRAFT_931346 [Pholiota conissans]
MPVVSQASSDYFEEDNSQFLAALQTAILPGDLPLEPQENEDSSRTKSQDDWELPPGTQPAPKQTSSTPETAKSQDEWEPPPATQPSLKRRPVFTPSDEDSADDIYGTPPRKRAKLEFENQRESREDQQNLEPGSDHQKSQDEFEPPPPAQPSKRRRSPTPEKDERVNSDDEVYGVAHYGNFGEYMRRKRAKLQIQNAQIGGRDDNPKIFEGLAIYVNGWTRPSVQELRRLIVLYGGTFQPYLNRKTEVTHVITCSLTGAKIRDFQNLKVVRPEWIVESVAKGYLLPWRDYIYTHDERKEAAQGVKINKQQNLLGHITSSTSASPASKPPPAPDPLYTTDPVTKADAARVPGYAADKSNPNAQRVMANPEWRKAHTSVASDFIEGYYKNSRLHHLSTWKAELKNLVQEAQERAENSHSSSTRKVLPEEGVSMHGVDLHSPSTAKWKGKGKAVDPEERVIMHCDFDCFFVSAGLVSRPELKGKPVVVCHSQGAQGGESSTSEIASSSYEARKFGIKNGMSLQQARKLCPAVITIPYEFQRYKEFSLLFYTVLMSHADDLQAVSVDEALIDVTFTVNRLREEDKYADGTIDPAVDFAETIRDEVRKATTCEISIGISHNILLARLATRRAKPAGSSHLFLFEVPHFMAPLDIADLHGFGWSAKQKAQEKLGVTTLGELEKKSKAILMEALGKSMGETLYNAIRGIDDKKLESDKPRKSVSCEINYGIRFENNQQAEAFIHQMATEVKKRLDAINMVGRSLTLKIMKRDPTAPVEPPKFLGHGICDLFNKQTPIIAPGGKATSDDKIIGEHAWRLLKLFNFDPRELRGIGIQVQKLESASSSAAPPPGQAVLPFGPKPVSANVASSSKAIFPQPALRIEPPTETTDKGDPVKPGPPVFDLPSFSQVDKSVFDALPLEIRQELEGEYKRRSATPFSRGPTVEPEKKQLGNVSMRRPLGRGSNSLFPSKAGPSNFKRIAQQLAPRRGGGGGRLMTATRSVVHAWAAKLREQKQKPTNVKISISALKNLNLDPEVFFALPIKVQREQLTMARIIKQKGYIPDAPVERKILKPAKFVLPPDFVPYRAPPPRAKHRKPPFLRQQGKTAKEKLYFTETDDIQRIVEQWVNVYKNWEPREKDVEFLSKWIMQSVDRAQASDVGVERAVAVMKWWLVLLRRYFGSAECLEEIDFENSQRNLVGEAWWAAFRKVKSGMDEITKKRFGGRLSLR